MIIGSALMVVTARNIIHAALWLISSFFGVASLYLLLEAEFLAVAQIMVYVGAISVLMLFAIMLTRHVTGQADEQYLYSRWWLSLLIAFLLFAAIITPTVTGYAWHRPPPDAITATGEAPPLTGALEIGKAFVYEYLLPFQVVAILLLVALTGAIVIAYEERPHRTRVLTLAERLALERQQQAADHENPARPES